MRELLIGNRFLTRYRSCLKLSQAPEHPLHPAPHNSVTAALKTLFSGKSIKIKLLATRRENAVFLILLPLYIKIPRFAV